MAKCIKCKKWASYGSPRNYCEHHWLVWWFHGDKKLIIAEKKRRARERLGRKTIR